MAVLEELKSALDGGDPVLREWFLIKGYYWPTLLCVLYVLVVKNLGPMYMKSRKPYDLRNTMILYNFAIVAVYLYAFTNVLYYFLSTEVGQHVCNKTVIVPGDNTYKVASYGHILYLLKYVEFFDTIFFILRKKDHLITNLHVVHHAALPLIIWVIFRTEISGLQFIPGMLNGFVHILMYTYYGLAAMGPNVQKHLWWKKYLTIFQMVQFVVIFLFMVVFVPLSGCQTSKLGIALDLLFAVLFFALFLNYYLKTYKVARGKTPVMPSVAANGTCANGKHKWH